MLRHQFLHYLTLTTLYVCLIQRNTAHRLKAMSDSVSFSKHSDISFITAEVNRQAQLEQKGETEELTNTLRTEIAPLKKCKDQNCSKGTKISKATRSTVEIIQNHKLSLPSTNVFNETISDGSKKKNVLLPHNPDFQNRSESTFSASPHTKRNRKRSASMDLNSRMWICER